MVRGVWKFAIAVCGLSWVGNHCVILVYIYIIYEILVRLIIFYCILSTWDFLNFRAYNAELRAVRWIWISAKCVYRFIHFYMFFFGGTHRPPGLSSRHTSRHQSASVYLMLARFAILPHLLNSFSVFQWVFSLRRVLSCGTDERENTFWLGFFFIYII